LRRAKKGGLGADEIKSLATEFHQLHREYQKASRAEKRVSEKQSVAKQRRRCVTSFY
jgi:hypothetical protein